MSDDAQADDREQSISWLGTFLLVAALMFVAVLLVQAWLRLPEDASLVEPVAPGVESEIMRAIEAATTPADRAGLSLQLAALEQEDAARRSGLRNSIAQVGTALLAGIAAGWGAVAAWNQMRDNRRRTDTLRDETDAQLKLTRDAQLAERFSRAIDHLGQSGTEKLDVRLGGIYALERIARDSESDMPTVVQVLAAFVRGHSPLPQSVNNDEVRVDQTERDGGSEPLSRRAPDVNAALVVLGGIEREPDSVSLDLTSTDLRDAILRDALLQGASLSGANLQNAFLDGANLQDAWLNRVNLQRAWLSNANLQGARLSETNMERASLGGANLQDADLGGANLQAAFLVGADLTDAGLHRANLKGANLRGADLCDARLWNTELEGAQASVRTTTWPPGFDPEAAGVIFVDREESPDEPEPDGGE